jgi:hypothetical protein
MEKRSAHFWAGAAAAALAAGTDVNYVRDSEIFVKRAMADEVFKRSVCKAVSFMFEESQTWTKTASLYDIMGEKEEWQPVYDDYVHGMLDSLGGAIRKAASEISPEEQEVTDVDTMLKDAAVRNIMAGLVSRGVSLTPEAMRALAVTAAGTGSVAAALHFMLNKSTKEDAADNEATRAKAVEYERLTRDIQDELQQRGLAQA